MSIATFQQRVSRAIKRGNVFDKDIPGYAKDAVRTLENIRDWKHMWVEEEVVLTAGTSSRTIARLKNLRYIKEVMDDGSLRRILKVSSEQVTGVSTDATPSGYWLSAQTVVQFDASPGTDITLKYGYYLYSEYDDNLPWLTVEESILVAQTGLEMVALLKDPKATAAFSGIVSQKLPILEIAELDAEYDGQDNSMIPYADAMDNFITTGVDDVA
jgi:hypothetical protein